MGNRRALASIMLLATLGVVGCVSGSAATPGGGSPIAQTATLTTPGTTPSLALSSTSALVAPSTSSAAGTFVATGSMAVERDGESATVLPNGLVLVAGGRNKHSVPLTSAELYDPKTGTFSPTGSMSYPRTFHTASLLTDGTVPISSRNPNSTTQRPASSVRPVLWPPPGSIRRRSPYRTVEFSSLAAGTRPEHSLPPRRSMTRAQASSAPSAP
jgi:hypothetical protein